MFSELLSYWPYRKMSYKMENTKRYNYSINERKFEITLFGNWTKNKTNKTNSFEIWYLKVKKYWISCIIIFMGSLKCLLLEWSLILYNKIWNY